MVNYAEIVDSYLEIAASYERCAELTNENSSKKEAKRKKEYLECAKKWRDKTSFWLICQNQNNQNLQDFQNEPHLLAFFCDFPKKMHILANNCLHFSLFRIFFPVFYV